MKIYISGKITGIEAEAAGLFAEAAYALRKAGHEPVNPMQLPHDHDHSHAAYMRESLKAMLGCDGIYLLDNWMASPESCLERKVAGAAGLIFL